MSWPTTTPVAAAPVTSTNADPTARARSLVDLVGHGAPHVVRLEDGGQGARPQVADMSRQTIGRERRPALRRSGVGSARRWPRRPTSRHARPARGRRRAAVAGAARHRAGRLADRVGEREQVVGGGAERVRVGREPEHLPARGAR